MGIKYSRFHPLAAERQPQLVRIDIGRLRGLLYRHPELYDIQKELQQVLVLGIAALDGEAEKRLAIFQRQSRGERHARPFPRREDIKRVFRSLEDEALHALAHADARVAGDHGGHPPAAGRHGHDPPLLVRGLDGRGPRRVVLLCAAARHHLGLGCARRAPGREQVAIGVLAALEGIGIARAHVRIVALRAHLGQPPLRILLAEQSLHRLLGRKVDVAVIEVAVGEGQVHGLIDGVDVARGVVAHGLEIDVLQDVERLQHGRPLRPGVELVDVDPLVCRADRLLEAHLPARQVFLGDQPALLAHAAHQLVRDVAFVEAVVGGHDRVLAALLGAQRLLLGLHELAQRGREIGLAEDLARLRRLALLARVREEDGLRVRPFPGPLLGALDRPHELRFDGIAVGHLDGGREHVGEREPSPLGEHDHEPARRARRDRGQRPELRGDHHLPGLEEGGRRPRRRHPERVHADDLPRPGVVHQGLGLAAPAQRVPHGGGRGQHRAGGVDGVAAPGEDQRARGGAQRLAGDGDPVPAMQRRLGRGRSREAMRRQADGHDGGHDEGPALRSGHRSLPKARFCTSPAGLGVSGRVRAPRRARAGSMGARPDAGPGPRHGYAGGGVAVGVGDGDGVAAQWPGPVTPLL